MDSLQNTLLLTYLFIGFVPLLLFTNIIFHTIDTYMVEELQKRLLSQANQISGKISSSGYFINDSLNQEFNQELKMLSEKGNYRILVIEENGVVVNDSANRDTGKTYLVPEVIEALNTKDVAKRQLNGTIYAVASVVDGNSQRVGAVLIVASTQELVDTVNNIKHKAYLLFLAIAFLVGIIMFFMARFFTDPLKRMMRVIVKMSEGHLDQRVEVKEQRYNEINDLAVACNNMAEKLQQVEITRQHFVSNVSHELKTPLSSVKVLSESILLQDGVPIEMYIEFLQDINSEVDRMTAIINDLLTLVRLDQKEIPISFTETNLSFLMNDIVKRLQPLAQEKEIEIIYDDTKEVLADMDSMKITLALSNLLDNAIKYTLKGGTVTATVDADHQNAFVTISDTGLGIPDDEISKIFERFYRVDKTRDRQTGGTGLGLSITHSTVMMHNGSIKVNSKEDEGTTFLVRIPLHQAGGETKKLSTS